MLTICHLFKLTVTDVFPIFLQSMYLNHFSSSSLRQVFSLLFSGQESLPKTFCSDLGISRPLRRQLSEERSHLNGQCGFMTSWNKAMFFAYCSIYSHMHILAAIIKYCCIIPKASASDKIKAFFPRGVG